MSQPKPLAPGEKDDPGAPIPSKQALIDYIASGEKPREQFRVGTEHEKFGFFTDTKAPLTFDGPRGIEAILEAICGDSEETAENGPWVRIEERGRLIGLSRGYASITLEPGGQLELSGAPLSTIHETCQEVGHHLSLLKRVCIPRGVGFIGMGFHPTAKWEDFPTVPKSRYGIMRRYMPTRGTRGLDMMKRTSTVQANFDFSSEADMVSAVQTGMLISPLITALFANSPFVEGKPSGRLSERAFVWTDTDPDRCGFPDIFFDDDFGYEKYVDWVLDVPMYFIRRDGLHHDHAGASFRTFMDEGIGGIRATMRDFEDHLTTVFPEVRVKRYIEVRSADCGPWSRICALPAIWKGILYDDTARDAARALMDGSTPAELRALHRDVAERGFAATHRGKKVLDLCASLVDISRAGLGRISAADGTRDESGFLKAVEEAVDANETFAEQLLRLYRDEWDEDLSHLWEHLEFFSQDD